MNKQEAKQKLDKLEKRRAELQAIINAPELTPEQLFKSLVDGLSVCIVDSGNVIYYNEKKEWVIEIENSDVWFQFDRFWVKFYNEFSWDYNQTQSFLKSQLEEHFKMKGVTVNNWGLPIPDRLEEHFKMKGTQR